jgi:hypothetical protein
MSEIRTHNFIFFIGGWNRVPSDLQKVTDNIYHIEDTSSWAGFKLTALVVTRTDCTGF